MMKRVFLFWILCVVYVAPCLAQENTVAVQPSFSAIIVKDIDASIAWYEKVFSMEVLNKVHLTKRGIKQANLRSDTFSLELIELSNSIDPEPILSEAGNKARMQGFFKMGFYVPDFDAWIAHLKQHEVLLGDVVEDPVSYNRMVIVRDPDGNRIQFFEEEN